jgi:cation diffusion facilitator CzcD-associated flavoprotein CzcO
MSGTRIGIIGAGASGIGVAKALRQAAMEFEVLEATSQIGGNWCTEGRAAKMYNSAHLISSRRNTQFSDFPMPADYPPYPRHNLMLAYLENVARAFDIESRTRFNESVISATRDSRCWRVTCASGYEASYDMLVVCNGLLRSPIVPSYPGHFDGETIHAGDYRHADIFNDKKVLVVGGGNSGCDIAVDAATRSRKTSHSTRRGYYYMPKFIHGRPTQEWLMDQAPRFPDSESYWTHVRDTFRLAGYDGEDYGLPSPDHRIEESHPILNSLILYYIGHGDVTPRPDIARLDGKIVHFTDGAAEEFDLIIWATGYEIDMPFFARGDFNVAAEFPELFLKIVPRRHDDLLFCGYLNTPSGIGNVANIMGKFVAAYIGARARDSDAFHAFQALKAHPTPVDIGEARFMKTARHRSEVDLWKFIKTLNFVTGRLSETKVGAEKIPA